jgi:hypothetical protein
MSRDAQALVKTVVSLRPVLVMRIAFSRLASCSRAHAQGFGALYANSAYTQPLVTGSWASKAVMAMIWVLPQLDSAACRNSSAS